MRKTQVTLVALVAASWLTVGCSSSGGSNSGSGGSSAGSGSGGNSGSGSGGNSSGGGGSSSNGSGGSNGTCVLPKTWTDNLEGQSSTCVSCVQMNCCDSVVACASSTNDCLPVYTCEQKCYEGIGPDGGAVADDDAGVDDAGNTAMDNCREECVKLGTATGQMLWHAQDDCVNGLIPPATTCGKKEVCD